MTIKTTDPRHKAAKKVLDAMYAFWKLQPQKGAVQWVEDNEGKVCLFTRGEYLPQLLANIHPLTDVEIFELEGPNDNA